MSTDIFGCLQPDELSTLEDKIKKFTMVELYSGKPDICPHHYIISKHRTLVSKARLEPFDIKCEWCGDVKTIKYDDPEWEKY